MIESKSIPPTTLPKMIPTKWMTWSCSFLSIRGGCPKTSSSSTILSIGTVGLEPTTTGFKILGSTIELRPSSPITTTNRRLLLSHIPGKLGNMVTLNTEWWVYVIQSQKPRFNTKGLPLPGVFYVGSTTDYRRRLREHNGEIKRGGKYTSQHRPWLPAALYGPYGSRSDAFKAEMALKKGKRSTGRTAWSTTDSPWCCGLGAQDPWVTGADREKILAKAVIPTMGVMPEDTSTPTTEAPPVRRRYPGGRFQRRRSR